MIIARRVFTCGALLFILAARPCSAQIGYRALVEEYAYGRTAASAADLAGAPEASVRSAIGSAQLPLDRIKAAAMLHTETALVASTQALAFFHIDHARALLASVAKVDRDRLDLVIFTGRWSAIEAIVHASFGDVRGAQRVLDGALRTNDDNVDALLVLGALQEMELGGNEPNPRGGWNGRVDYVEARAKAAADSYAALVQRHPESVEARLRLGWALLINHSTTERAREPLQTAAARAIRPDLRYLAHLFLGAVEASDGHLDQAASEYAQAHAILPRQASFMALVQIDRARGRLNESEQLALAFARNPGGLDPWQSYHAGMTGDELLEWLRTEARAR
jgi:tetratricopeptide (TPR) repeat protein